MKYRTTWTFSATNRNPVSANVLYIFCIVRSLFCWKADITQCNSDSISNTNTLCVIISRVTKSGATVRADTWGDFWSRPPSVVDQPLKKLHRSINCCTRKAKRVIRGGLLDKFWQCLQYIQPLQNPRNGCGAFRPLFFLLSPLHERSQYPRLYFDQRNECCWQILMLSFLM